MIKTKQYLFTSFVILFLVGLCFQSCDSETTYTEALPVKSNGWSKSDTLVFTPIIENNVETYNIYAWVRHSKGYKYSNIWLKVLAEPNFIEHKKGLFEIPIADKAGVWIGECTQSMCTSRVLLRENYRFEKTGAFKVDVIQYMREDVLKEVKDVGLDFELVE